MDIPRGWIWPAGHQLINTNLNHAIINPSTPELLQNLQQWLQRRFSNLDISLEKTFDPDRYSGSWTFPGYSQSLLPVLSWSDLLLRVFFVILLYYSTSIQAVLWDPGKKIKYSSTVAVSNFHLLDAFYHVIQQSLLFFHIKISMTVSTSGLKHLWLKTYILLSFTALKHRIPGFTEMTKECSNFGRFRNGRGRQHGNELLNKVRNEIIMTAELQRI